MSATRQSGAWRPEVPSTLDGRYALVAEVEALAYGVLYAAQDLATDERVSVTVFHPAFFAEGYRKRNLERLRRAAKYRHPHLAAIRVVAENYRPVYVVADPVEGQPLTQWRRDGQSAASAAAGAYRVVGQIIDALTAVHRHGVHGALGPSTVRIVAGQAWLLNPYHLDPPLELPAGELPPLRAAWLAPEQLYDVAPEGPGTDIYAVGLVLGFLLARGLTEPGHSLMVQGLDVPPPLDDVYVRATARQPELRYGSLAELRLALEAAAGSVWAEAQAVHTEPVYVIAAPPAAPRPVELFPAADASPERLHLASLAPRAQRTDDLERTVEEEAIPADILLDITATAEALAVPLHASGIVDARELDLDEDEGPGPPPLPPPLPEEFEARSSAWPSAIESAAEALPELPSPPPLPIDAAEFGPGGTLGDTVPGEASPILAETLEDALRAGGRLEDTGERLAVAAGGESWVLDRKSLSEAVRTRRPIEESITRVPGPRSEPGSAALVGALDAAIAGPGEELGAPSAWAPPPLPPPIPPASPSRNAPRPAGSASAEAAPRAEPRALPEATIPAPRQDVEATQPSSRPEPRPVAEVTVPSSRAIARPDAVPGREAGPPARGEQTSPPGGKRGGKKGGKGGKGKGGREAEAASSARPMAEVAGPAAGGPPSRAGARPDSPLTRPTGRPVGMAAAVAPPGVAPAAAPKGSDAGAQVGALAAGRRDAAATAAPVGSKRGLWIAAVLFLVAGGVAAALLFGGGGGGERLQGPDAVSSVDAGASGVAAADTATASGEDTSEGPDTSAASAALDVVSAPEVGPVADGDGEADAVGAADAALAEDGAVADAGEADAEDAADAAVADTAAVDAGAGGVAFVPVDWRKLECPGGMAKVKKAITVALPGGGEAEDFEVYCIDRYEYPGAGQMPQVDVDLGGARAACAGRGKRLCTKAEWRRACGGKYPYGRDYDPEACNSVGEDGLSRPLVPSGSKARCKGGPGTFDMVGNVAEWTSDGFVNGGGAYKHGENGTCGQASRRSGGHPYVGFRCCADAK